MSVKIHRVGSGNYAVHGEQTLYAFNCPGCGYPHAFQVPRWSWNGSFDKPTFQPSLACDAQDPAHRCHSFVTNGQIQFQGDCGHALAGKTVDLPDWDGNDG